MAGFLLAKLWQIYVMRPIEPDFWTFKQSRQ